MKLRRRAWQAREVPLEPEGLAPWASAQHTPHEDAEQALGPRGAPEGLSRTRSRRTSGRCWWRSPLNGVPIDVMAERLGTTRGALYKTLHDARGQAPGPPGRERNRPPSGSGRTG